MPKTEREVEEGGYNIKSHKGAHGYLKKIDKEFGKFVNLWNKRFLTKGKPDLAGLNIDVYHTLEKIKPLLHRLKLLDAQGDKYFKGETAELLDKYKG